MPPIQTPSPMKTVKKQWVVATLLLTAAQQGLAMPPKAFFEIAQHSPQGFSTSSRPYTGPSALVIKPSSLKAKPHGFGKEVAELLPGTLVYPTGKSKGKMWEVDDPGGRRGWISSDRLKPHWSPPF